MANPKDPPPIPKRVIAPPPLPDAKMAVPLPPPRSKLKPLSHAQRCASFGTFKFTFIPTPAAPERIEIDRKWLAENIVVLPIPHLAHLNASQPVKMRVHRLAAAHWLELFDAWRAARLTQRILSYDGSFVARYKRGMAGGGAENLSNHSWGTAVDLNARWNRLGTQPAGADKLGTVLPLVSIANDLGFAWGGDFTRQDGMHFELVRI